VLGRLVSSHPKTPATGPLTGSCRYRTGPSVSGNSRRAALDMTRITRVLSDLAQPRTGRTTIVITLSNQQGYVSDTCGQAERKAVRGQASRSLVRFRWADPAVNRHAISCPPTAASRGTRRTGSARLHAPPCADRRAWRRTRAAPTCATAQNRPRPDDELAAARTGAAARAVSPGLRRAGRLRAPAPIWSTSTGAIPATTDRTSPH
jgi:hypothetical protein